MYTSLTLKVDISFESLATFEIRVPFDQTCQGTLPWHDAVSKPIREG